MNFSREEKDGCVVLKINGNLSVYEVANLRDELVACFDMYDGLTLDLNEVNDCDTAGIQLLCSAGKTAAETGKNFAVSVVSVSVGETLECAGLDTNFAGYRGYEAE